MHIPPEQCFFHNALLTLRTCSNGIGAFLERPFDTRKFIASYISVNTKPSHSFINKQGKITLTLTQVPVFLLLLLGYKIRKHGLAFSQWGPERSNDLRNTVQAASEIRKGRLEFPDEGLTKRNGRMFLDWIWVWMK